MNPAPEWSGPQPIGATEPSSPYAHFAFRDQYRRRARAARRARLLSFLPGMHDRPPCGRQGLHVETVSSVSDALARQLGPLDRIVGIQLPEDVVNPNLTDLDDAPTAAVKSDADWPSEIPKPGTDRPPVFIGIVDDAIAFAHQRFRLPNGKTRFDYLWLQGVRYHEGDPVPFGQQLDRTRINSLPERARRGGDLPRGRADRHEPSGGAARGAGVQPRHCGARRRRRLSAAALQTAAARPIAAVCLPPEVTSDTLGTFAEDYVILGLERLLAHLEQRRESGAGDDGSGGHQHQPGADRRAEGRLEPARPASSRETAARHAPLCYVLPAGNHRLSRIHAHFDAHEPRGRSRRRGGCRPTTLRRASWKSGARRGVRSGAS